MFNPMAKTFILSSEKLDEINMENEKYMKKFEENVLEINKWLINYIDDEFCEEQQQKIEKIEKIEVEEKIEKIEVEEKQLDNKRENKTRTRRSRRRTRNRRSEKTEDIKKSRRNRRTEKSGNTEKRRRNRGSRLNKTHKIETNEIKEVKNEIKKSYAEILKM